MMDRHPSLNRFPQFRTDREDSRESAFDATTPVLPLVVIRLTSINS